MHTLGAAHSVKGKGHHLNEDRYRLLGSAVRKVASATRGHVYAVMDGVGGAPGGMRAAQLVADSITRFFTDASVPPTREGLRNLLHGTNSEAHGWGMIEGTDRPRGATAATVAWFAPSRELVIFHVGDTMAFHFDGERLLALTRDHGSGKALLRYIGQGARFRLDETVTRVDEGDTLCLVTDGVTKTMAPEHIAAVLREVSEPSRAAQELVDRARSRGSPDDITAVVVELEEW